MAFNANHVFEEFFSINHSINLMQTIFKFMIKLSSMVAA